jgi:DNA-binding NarL/FixJ family response regulator
MTLRVLLAEDHVLIRAGLRLLLEQIGQVTVVAEAGDGAEALRLLALHRPDIAVLDIAMGAVNGLEVAARVQVELPEVRVIILSMHATDSYVQQALRSGARGYLLKDAAPVELSLAIGAVMRGETYLSPAIASRVVRHLVQGPAEAHPGLEQLTPRQRTILHLVAEGRTTQEIARQLQISVKTVEGHRAQLMERLGIHDVAGLVRLAIRAGLIDGGA